jgi:hypothetical protein
MYFPPNEQVPAEEENPKPRIFQLQIRLDIHGSSPQGFLFEGSTFRNLMGTDSVTSNLYNSFISGNATVVSESHYLLIFRRTDFKSDPSGMNRCLKHCADGLIQAPCDGPVVVLKCMGFSFFFLQNFD